MNVFLNTLNSHQLNYILFKCTDSVQTYIKYFAGKKKQTAFVHFKTLMAVAQCISTPIAHHLDQFKRELAPYTYDVVWPHLIYTTKSNACRQIIVNSSIILLIIPWMSLTTASVNIINTEQIIEYLFKVQMTKYLLNSKLLQFLFSIIPPMILYFWLTTLEYIIHLILNAIFKFKSKAKLEMQFYSIYYMCLIFMVLLGMVVSNILTENIVNILRKFESIFQTLALSLITTSTIFINYVLLSAFIFLPWQLWNRSSLFFQYICCRIWYV